MPCAERDKLLQLLLEAAKEYSDAVHAMLDHEGEALQRLTALAESARKTHEDCYDVLVAHERSHGCAAEAVGTSTL
jgi:rubrerythrin